ncbi:MAG: bifunctional metallophosphatase/5'-nucleotidase [Flintibacter sp.]|uniref:bifunctional metallophosphatase/5'-nucleotidase n=1 Tax=Flintibacter sp. TaxID=1918624 RepID=UPI002D802785|nr:bifunctional UDP-sugar hydrolase/5'-nucleotidase [Flintibacter sp.]MCI7159329.1 bifunctional metallophosphatase/5'-nucleotidase [Flintibacter sp.]
MKRLRAAAAIILVLLLLCAALPCAVLAAGEGESHETTVLFTHDLHSHFLPQTAADGGESGGYARLATVLRQERAQHPDALTLDGGDFSIGSLIQTLYTSKAPELRTMGALGYDATTAGNHEFDHEGLGFARMLTAARTSGDTVPALLMANYKPSDDNPDQLDIQRAMSAYGVKDYMLLERGGVTYGIFGLMGTDSDDCAPTSGFTLEDPIEAAKRCVKALEEQGAQFIICLSHGGTNVKESMSEDQQLAKKVDGIDLIISGHTHTTLTEPIVEGDTYIVSAGPYCENLGSITLEWTEDGEKTLKDYRLTPIDETVAEDQTIATLVEGWKNQVSSSYLASYGLSYDQVLTTSDYDLPKPQNKDRVDNALGNLVADAYHWASTTLVEDAPDVETVAVVADGVLRASLYKGNITTSQAFDVLSMGVGEDGKSGYPLVSCYLTGKELKAVMEVDASVSPIMTGTQLYMSGAQYSFNTHRLIFNRVTGAQLEEPAYAVNFGSQSLSKLENDKLYRVVSGMYSAQMLGTVKDKSFGILSIVPKDENGQPITDFSTRILRDKNGNEIKEWYALAAYLQNFGTDGVPSHYEAGSCKTISTSWNPIELVKNPSLFSVGLVLVFILLVVLVVFLVRTLIRRGRRRRGGGYRRRRFL